MEANLRPEEWVAVSQAQRDREIIQVEETACVNTGPLESIVLLSGNGDGSKLAGGVVVAGGGDDEGLVNHATEFRLSLKDMGFHERVSTGESPNEIYALEQGGR